MVAQSASPLFLREEEIRRGVELLWFGYGHLTRAIDEGLAAKGLGRAHHRTLYFVARQPGLTVSALLKLLGVTKQSLGRVVTELTERGLIEMKPGVADRRQRLLRLTPAGSQLESALFEALRERMAQAYVEAGQGSIAGFWTVLEGLIPPGNAPASLACNATVEGEKRMAAIDGFSATTIDGKTVSLGDYAGKVRLIVNTASKCGFTPQYEGLEKLHEELGPRGLAVLGFPCNQFGAQEPGDAAEIANFCSLTYDVRFPMFAKVDVNGPATHPLFAYLKHEAKGLLGSEGIKWNFTKFLIDRAGHVVDRFAPTTKPEALRADIEKLL